MKMLRSTEKQPPLYLYHGSAFKQSELKPGYEHSKELVKWDRYESNDYLYATSDRDQAILLGISSAWEKKWDLKRVHIDHDRATVEAEFYEDKPAFKELRAVECWVYTLQYDQNVWMRNRNPYNDIDTEYKTKRTIKRIIDINKIDTQKILERFDVKIL